MTYRHRMSSLPVVQFCAQGGRLGSMGAARSAAQSTCFHALCAKAPNALELQARLTDEELAEIMTWKAPGDVDLGGGRILKYADSEKELAVALNASGEYVDPASPDAIIVGHLDFAWVVEFTGGMRLAYVGDIKRSEFTTKDGPDSLQLQGYGLAYAGLRGCDGYVPGIWAATEGRWQWGEIVDLSTREALTIMRRIVAAAQNYSDEYATGPHCRDCYGRFRCPAWLMPVEVAKTKLAPLAQPDGLTHENAAEMLLLYQAYEDAAKRVGESLREFAARNGGIKDKKTGKVWKPVVCNGRASVDIARVRQMLGDRAHEVMTQGKPYERFSWVNDKRSA